MTAQKSYLLAGYILAVFSVSCLIHLSRGVSERTPLKHIADVEALSDDENNIGEPFEEIIWQATLYQVEFGNVTLEEYNAGCCALACKTAVSGGTLEQWRDYYNQQRPHYEPCIDTTINLGLGVAVCHLQEWIEDNFVLTSGLPDTPGKCAAFMSQGHGCLVVESNHMWLVYGVEYDPDFPDEIRIYKFDTAATRKYDSQDMTAAAFLSFCTASDKVWISF